MKAAALALTPVGALALTANTANAKHTHTAVECRHP
jgi:hypothetical protein